eukprot:Clim_evm1s222 gene=Clim_evmTU1s222
MCQVTTKKPRPAPETVVTKLKGSPFVREELIRQKTPREDTDAQIVKDTVEDVMHALTSVAMAIFMAVTSYIMSQFRGAREFLFAPAERFKTWTPPNPIATYLAALSQFLIYHPVVSGIENVPLDRPVLFYLNHATGATDTGVAFEVVRRVSMRPLRACADTAFWSSWPTNRVLEYFGAFKGNRRLCDMAMREEQNILIYPEGAKGVFKSKNVPKYTLMWGKRAGFAHMAAMHGYDLVPVSIVGGEEFFDVWFDVPCGWMFRILDGNNKRGHWTAPIGKPWKMIPQNIYINFGKPIRTDHLQGRTDPKKVWRVREEARKELERGIMDMKIEQSKCKKYGHFLPHTLEQEISETRWRQIKKRPLPVELIAQRDAERAAEAKALALAGGL